MAIQRFAWLFLAEVVAERRVITSENSKTPGINGKSTKLHDMPDETQLLATCESDTYRPCVDGLRPHPKCALSFTFRDQSYSGTCIKGNVRDWCPFKENASSLTLLTDDWGFCDSCNDWADPPDALDLWRPAMEKLTCSSRSDGGRFLSPFDSFPILASAGDATGRKFSFQTINQIYTPVFGGRSSDTLFEQWWENVYPMFSAGKWPATAAIAGTVRDGYLSWDTRANEVWDWWTTSPDDSRSRITLRNLLQFRSGFVAPEGDLHGFSVDCMLSDALGATLDECAKQVYEQAEHAAEPGDLFNYNSLHLTVALAMATKLTGLDPESFLQDYLYTPYGMTKTQVLFGKNPLVAATMLSTPKDYESFLQKYLSYEILPKEIVDVMETPTLVANKPDWGMGLYSGQGEYSLSEDLPNTGWGVATYENLVDNGWGGGLWASVNREKGTYMFVAPIITSYPGELYATLEFLPKDLGLREANFALDLWKTVRNEVHASMDRVRKWTSA